MIKKILIALVGIIIVLLLIGFVLPAKVEVSRSITINAPAEYAFEEVNNLENWSRWSYWHTLDTTMQVAYGEATSNAGAWYSWKGNDDVGEGKLTITESVPYSSIKSDLDFMEMGTAKSNYLFEPDGDGTKVTMTFETDFGNNIIGRWMGLLFMDSEIGKAFDSSLGKLKELAEAKPKFTVALSQEQVAPISYIGISTTMSYEDGDAIGAAMGKSYGELMAVLQKSKVEPAGHPFCLYPMWDDQTKMMEMVCALPVPADAKLPAKYKVMQTAGGMAVKAVHLGHYEKLEDTHNQLNAYIAFKKLTISGAPWEVYVTDPETESDTSKWVTEVYYPVNK